MPTIAKLGHRDFSKINYNILFKTDFFLHFYDYFTQFTKKSFRLI